tara:strand:+ start:66 stop:299 length:234 start_codon:yes stop_codon:yes gene_type:complete
MAVSATVELLKNSRIKLYRHLYYTKWVFSKFQKQRNRIVLITFKKINPVFKPQKKMKKHGSEIFKKPHAMNLLSEIK